MKSLLIALSAAVVLAPLWRGVVESEAVPSRTGLTTVKVGADWYATLPLEPAAATGLASSGTP